MRLTAPRRAAAQQALKKELVITIKHALQHVPGVSS